MFVHATLQLAGAGLRPRAHPLVSLAQGSLLATLATLAALAATLLTAACTVDRSNTVPRSPSTAPEAITVATPHTAINITPPGAIGGFGLGINDQGAAAMLVDFPDRRAGFLRKANGSLVDVGSLPGGLGDTWATDVNNTTQVAGFSRTKTARYASVTHAYVWSESNGMRDLGTLGGPHSLAWAINNVGQVVGGSDIKTPPNTYPTQHAFLWSPGTGEMQDLGSLGDGSPSEARDVNDLGQVVGDWGGGARAFIWTKVGGMIDLGIDGIPSIATGINNQGVVVGYLFFPFQVTHAFRWTSAGGMVDLGTFNGTSAGLTDINNGGLIAGVSSNGAFLRSPTGQLTSLPDLGAGGTSVVAVNRCGQAIGDAYVPGSAFRQPVLWTKSC